MIKWENPPPGNRRGPRTPTKELLLELIHRPGVWGLMVDEPFKGNDTSTRVKNRLSARFGTAAKNLQEGKDTVPGKFSFAVRTDKNRGKCWGIFVVEGKRVR